MAVQARIVRMRQKGSYLEASGKVTNDTDRPLKDARAVVSYFNQQGDLIDTESVRIKQSILMPGETSAFKIFCLWDPAIARGRVQVSEPSPETSLSGGCDSDSSTASLFC